MPYQFDRELRSCPELRFAVIVEGNLREVGEQAHPNPITQSSWTVQTELMSTSGNLLDIRPEPDTICQGMQEGPIKVSIKHAILTRFNLATPGREKAIRNQPGWLEERFELFERYCLPTVAAQTLRDFHWIVFFDQETPAAFKDRIERLRKVQEFHPYYTGLFPADGWANAIREVLGPQLEGTRLLTTRLDNDDGLACDYVERLRDEASLIETLKMPIAFNFTQGFILYQNRLYSHRHTSNAFASLFESFGMSMRTVATIPHMDLENQVALHQIDGPGAWLQVIHETNVSNKIRGLRVSARDVQGRFSEAVSADFQDISASAALLENATYGLMRGARDRLLDLRRAIMGNKPV